MKRKVLLIPLIIFLAIATALLWQLARNAELILSYSRLTVTF